MKRVISALVAILLMVGCSKDEDVVQIGSSEITGTWIMNQVNGEEVSTNEYFGCIFADDKQTYSQWTDIDGVNSTWTYKQGLDYSITNNILYISNTTDYLELELSVSDDYISWKEIVAIVNEVDINRGYTYSGYRSTADFTSDITRGAWVGRATDSRDVNPYVRLTYESDGSYCYQFRDSESDPWSEKAYDGRKYYLTGELLGSVWPSETDPDGYSSEAWVVDITGDTMVWTATRSDGSTEGFLLTRDEDVAEDEEDISPSESILTSTDSDNYLSLSILKGLAADGASSLDIFIPVKKSNSDPIIEITPQTEDWGIISANGKMELETENFNFYRYTLTSEETLPTDLENSDIAELVYDIAVSDQDGNSLGASISIEVIRPAVIFAHGLASNAATYDPMLSYIRPLGLYLDEALYALDYAATSTSSYSVNINVIPSAIDYTRNILLEKGYVNKKMSVIGHSMGGILTRLYIQNESTKYAYDDDILKMITIDTPHSGSQLADFALTLGDDNEQSILNIFSKMGAIVDLAVGSDATKNLNDEAKLAAANSLEIPTHVVTAHIGTLLDVAELIKEDKPLYAALTFMLNAIEQKFIYGDDEHDTIVPMTSQQGGVSNTLRGKYVTTYSNEWHCSVHTTEDAALDIIDLLNAQSSDNTLFTTDGFAPEELTYANASNLTLTAVASRPILSEIANHIVIGINSQGEIISAAYDEGEDDSLSLDGNSEIASQLYIALLNSGEIQYMQL